MFPRVYYFRKSLHGKLVKVPSRGLLIFFVLNSNDDLDAVLSTDLGEQLCFKFLIIIINNNNFISIAVYTKALYRLTI